MSSQVSSLRSKGLTSFMESPSFSSCLTTDSGHRLPVASRSAVKAPSATATDRRRRRLLATSRSLMTSPSSFSSNLTVDSGRRLPVASRSFMSSPSFSSDLTVDSGRRLPVASRSVPVTSSAYEASTERRRRVLATSRSIQASALTDSVVADSIAVKSSSSVPSYAVGTASSSGRRQALLPPLVARAPLKQAARDQIVSSRKLRAQIQVSKKPAPLVSREPLRQAARDQVVSARRARVQAQLPPPLVAREPLEMAPPHQVVSSRKIRAKPSGWRYAEMWAALPAESKVERTVSEHIARIAAASAADKAKADAKEAAASAAAVLAAKAVRNALLEHPLPTAATSTVRKSCLLVKERALRPKKSVTFRHANEQFEVHEVKFYVKPGKEEPMQDNQISRSEATSQTAIQGYLQTVKDSLMEVDFCTTVDPLIMLDDSESLDVSRFRGWEPVVGEPPFLSADKTRQFQVVKDGDRSRPSERRFPRGKSSSNAHRLGALNPRGPEDDRPELVDMKPCCLEFAARGGFERPPKFDLYFPDEGWTYQCTGVPHTDKPKPRCSRHARLVLEVDDLGWLVTPESFVADNSRFVTDAQIARRQIRSRYDKSYHLAPRQEINLSSAKKVDLNKTKRLVTEIHNFRATGMQEYEDFPPMKYGILRSTDAATSRMITVPLSTSHLFASR